MDIREVDLTDEDVMAQLAAVAERVQFHERPHAPAFSATAHVAWLRADDSGEQKFLLAAFEGDRVLGVAAGFVFVLDNPDIAWLIVEVDPSQPEPSRSLAYVIGLSFTAKRP